MSDEISCKSNFSDCKSDAADESDDESDSIIDPYKKRDKKKINAYDNNREENNLFDYPIVTEKGYYSDSEVIKLDT